MEPLTTAAPFALPSLAATHTPALLASTGKWLPLEKGWPDHAAAAAADPVILPDL